MDYKKLSRITDSSNLSEGFSDVFNNISKDSFKDSCYTIKANVDNSDKELSTMLNMPNYMAANLKDRIVIFRGYWNLESLKDYIEENYPIAEVSLDADTLIVSCNISSYADMKYLPGLAQDLQNAIVVNNFDTPANKLEVKASRGAHTAFPTRYVCTLGEALEEWPSWFKSGRLLSQKVYDNISRCGLKRATDSGVTRPHSGWNMKPDFNKLSYGACEYEELEPLIKKIEELYPEAIKPLVPYSRFIKRIYYEDWFNGIPFLIINLKGEDPSRLDVFGTFNIDFAGIELDDYSEDYLESIKESEMPSEIEHHDGDKVTMETLPGVKSNSIKLRIAKALPEIREACEEVRAAFEPLKGMWEQLMGIN